MRETDEANGIFSHMVLVLLHNSNSPTELKPTARQEASVKTADIEIAQLAIIVRPQRDLFYVKF